MFFHRCVLFLSVSFCCMADLIWLLVVCIVLDNVFDTVALGGGASAGHS